VAARREYFDNYHASLTKKRGATADPVRELIDETHARIMAGDVPGATERKPAKVDKAKITEFVKSMSDAEFGELLAAFARGPEGGLKARRWLAA
jgi:hypothetical protein